LHKIIKSAKIILKKEIIMKVLLINGSPHEKGCTYTALEEVAKSLEKNGIETEIFWIGNNIKTGCIACHGCRKLGKCVFNDSVNVCNEKVKEADGFIFGTPVHYASASGNMTSFMDRLFYSGSKDAFYLKPAAAICSARRAGTTATFDQMNKYFTISQMPIISSCYWNMVHGHTPEEVVKDVEGMQTMRILGENMAYFLKCQQLAKNAGLEKPVHEKRIYTNFIREEE
jgi:multimeric flavodoxin WrbA